MWIGALLIVIYLLSPAILIYITKKSTFLNKLGAVVLAYLLGLIIGNSGLLPKASAAFRKLLGARTIMPETEIQNYLSSGQITPDDITFNQIATIQDTIMTVVILPAIPLLVFSLDILKSLELPR